MDSLDLDSLFVVQTSLGPASTWFNGQWTLHVLSDRENHLQHEKFWKRLSVTGMCVALKKHHLEWCAQNGIEVFQLDPYPHAIAHQPLLLTTLEATIGNSSGSAEI